MKYARLHSYESAASGCNVSRRQGTFMLQNIADSIKYCLDRAAAARDQAEKTTDRVLKAEYLHEELGWLRLARSYEFANSVENFLREPGSTTAAAWHQRILDAYNSLALKDAHEECGDQR